MPEATISDAGRLGGLAWIACLQFFVVEAITASRYQGYSYRFGFISDLGAVACGETCSPLHALMNASFMAQGALIASGLLLCRRALGAGRLAQAGLLCLAVCAAGVFVVGAAPEDVAPAWHYAGAAANLVGCNLAALTIGLSGEAHGDRARRSGILAGGLGLAACLALVSPIPDLLGVGVVERFAAYPFLLWLIAFGAAILRAVDGRARSDRATRRPGGPR